MKVSGKIQSDGNVTHLIADEIEDLSVVLDGLGSECQKSVESKSMCEINKGIPKSNGSSNIPALRSIPSFPTRG